MRILRHRHILGHFRKAGEIGDVERVLHREQQVERDQREQDRSYRYAWQGKVASPVERRHHVTREVGPQQTPDRHEQHGPQANPHDAQCGPIRGGGGGQELCYNRVSGREEAEDHDGTGERQGDHRKHRTQAEPAASGPAPGFRRPLQVDERRDGVAQALPQKPLKPLPAVAEPRGRRDQGCERGGDPKQAPRQQARVVDQSAGEHERGRYCNPRPPVLPDGMVRGDEPCQKRQRIEADMRAEQLALIEQPVPCPHQGDGDPQLPHEARAEAKSGQRHCSLPVHSGGRWLSRVRAVPRGG
jgi:hypothetical protein